MGREVEDAKVSFGALVMARQGFPSMENTQALDQQTRTAPGGLPEEEDFAKLFEESLQGRGEIKEGEIAKGTVIAVYKDYVVVDIGYKSEGQVALNEFSNAAGQVSVKPGDAVDVLVESRENDAGMVLLSKEKADKMRIWDEISEACKRDELVEGVVIGRVKGGLAVDIGVKAFLPGSQVDLRPIRNLDKLIGERFKFKVIKFNQKRGNIVLSRRALLEKEREELKKGTLEKLREGVVLAGVVKNLTDYGAFIDLGGIDGLLHITDMSWGRVQHPSEMLNVGDEIRVVVLKFDPATERVSLGLKQIQEDPWAVAEERFPVGSRAKGKVVSITDYGAFIELYPGVEGLVHISEMSWTKRVKHPSKLLSVGDQVEALVLDVDSKNKRISLGMKQIEANPWTVLEDKYPIGSVIRGQVKNVTDFGVFVGVEEGIDGLVHISDMSWTKHIKHPADMFKKGDEVEAVVLNIDVENERFSLGIKQLMPDPWSTLTERFPIGSRTTGVVTKTADFGAFVEIEPGIEGLVHVSEMKDERVEKPSDVVKEGDEVTVKVIDIDPNERKVSLSMKQAAREGDGDFHEYLKQQRSTKVTAQIGDLMKKFNKDK